MRAPEHCRAALLGALLSVMLVMVAGQAWPATRSPPPPGCGKLGAACCCAALDWQNATCCGEGLQCGRFSGAGFGTLPQPASLCVPRAAAASAPTSVKGCGAEGAACCMSGSRTGMLMATCSKGLMCSAPRIGWGSKAQHARLAAGFASAAADADVVGRCIRFSASNCGRALMPCGADAAAAGVTCPGGPAACASGHYCAAMADAGVGERCIPLPSDAGKAGGPCLPNNLPDAPIVSFSGQQTAPAFCRGGAVCFMPTVGNTTGFTYASPRNAKQLAARISSTICVNVAADCGTTGKQCCPSATGVITDKPLPSAKWGGAPCNSAASKWGVYCDGSFTALAAQPMGVCAANPECGAPGQPCCRYSRRGIGGVECPGIANGKGYCKLTNMCRLCPATLEIVEDIFRCI